MKRGMMGCFPEETHVRYTCTNGSLIDFCTNLPSSSCEGGAEFMGFPNYSPVAGRVTNVKLVP